VQHYQPYVATLPWEVKNSNFLQIFIRYGRYTFSSSAKILKIGQDLTKLQGENSFFETQHRSVCNSCLLFKRYPMCNDLTFMPELTIANLV